MSMPKAPAFTSYSTKVQDPILIRFVFVNGKKYVEFDVSLAAAPLCGDRINAVFAPDSMGVSLPLLIHLYKQKLLEGPGREVQQGQ